MSFDHSHRVIHQLNTYPAIRGRAMRENKDEQEHHELMAEQSVRVISIMDRRPTGKEIHGITHPGLFLVRSKLLDPTLDEKEGWIGADDPRMGPLSPNQEEGPICGGTRIACRDSSRIHIDGRGSTSVLFQPGPAHHVEDALIPTSSRNRQVNSPTMGLQERFIGLE